MVVETLKLGIAILNGGNAGVQQVRGAPTGSCRRLGVYPLDNCHALGKSIGSAEQGDPPEAPLLVFVLSGQLHQSCREHRKRQTREFIDKCVLNREGLAGVLSKKHPGFFHDWMIFCIERL